MSAMNLSDFDNIYTDFKGKVTCYVRGKVADVDQVEDIVEDIFLKVYNNLDRYDSSKSSLSSWIYTITSRTVTDYYRSRRLFDSLPSDNGEEGLMPMSLVDSQELDSDMIREETLDQLADALESLVERERDLIILHYYHGKTLKEVAVTMGMSYANAKIIHKKALNKMRGMMD